MAKPKTLKPKYAFKVKCCVCGKPCLPRMPKNGDGTFYFPFRHDFNGKPCDGNYQEAEIITE